MKKLILIRSASGGGKSYLAKQIAYEAVIDNKSVVIHNTDSVWMSKTNFTDEAYYFDFNVLYQAHQINQAKTAISMERGINVVIIDNTNTTLKEVKVYVDLAVKYGYTVEVVRPNTPWFGNIDEHFARNTHNVPKDVIQKQMDRLSRSPDSEVYEYYNSIRDCNVS
jgi:predicted kinase